MGDEKSRFKVKVNPFKVSQPFKCSVCQKPFKKRFQLTVHFRSHTGERPFPCKLCNLKFRTRNQATIHSKIHSDNRLTYSCLWCDKSFKAQDGLFTHYGSHTNEKPHFCKKCPNESFSSYYGLSFHDYRKHGDGTRHKCEICNKSCYSPSSLKRHMIIHNKNGEKPYSCAICGKAYQEKRGLKIHSAVHSETRLFNCLKCSKTFRHKSNLNYHVKVIHSELRPFKCEICGNSYKSKATRDEHTSSHLNEKPYLCSKCGKRFAYSAGLRYHQTAYHENKRDVKCSKCPCSFVQKSHLKIHYLKIHCDPSDRPLGCLFCAKRFTQKVELENHIRSHVREEPYFCSLCPFSAGHQRNLKKHHCRAHLEKHFRLNASEMPFECICKRKFKTKNRLIKHSSSDCGRICHACIWCDKTFKTIRSLTDHLRLHTNERPFDCEECPEVFSSFSKQNIHIARKHENRKWRKCVVCHKILPTPSTLDAHMRVHTGEKPFSCLVCGLAFARKQGLTIHSAVHHHT